MSGVLALLLAVQGTPAPSPEEIQKAREDYRVQLREEYARTQPELRQALARKFINAAETETQPVQRIAMLLEAADLAIEAGAVREAVAAIEALGQKSGRWLALRFRVLDLQERKDKPGPAPEAWMRLAAEADDEDDFALALKAVEKAEAAAVRRKDPAAQEQAKALKEQARSLVKESAAVEKAQLRLKEAPEDPAASEAVGRFLCFTRDQWEKGLPHLARASDPALAEAAGKDLDKPGTSELQAGLARLWREAARKNSARAKASCEQRAILWFETALLGARGIARLEIEQELDRFVKSLPAGDAPLPGLVFWVEPGRNPGAPLREIRQGLRGENAGVSPATAGTPALLFAGKSSVVYPAAGPAGAVGRNGSVFAWIKTDNVAQFGTVVNRCENRYEGPEDFGLYVHAGRLQCYFNWEPPDRPPVGSSTAAVPAGKWFLGGYTWDETRLTFYADGKKDNTIPLPRNAPLPRGSKVVLGVSTPAGPSGMEYYQGLTGSVMIFGRTLSDPEVERLHALTQRRFR